MAWKTTPAMAQISVQRVRLIGLPRPTAGIWSSRLATGVSPPSACPAASSATSAKWAASAPAMMASRELARAQRQ